MIATSQPLRSAPQLQHIACLTISGAMARAMIHAQPSSLHSRSCHSATKVKMSQTLSNRQRLPPMGMYMYRTSHWLYEACQLRQKPWCRCEQGVGGGSRGGLWQ